LAGYFSYHDFSTTAMSLDFNFFKLNGELTDIEWVTRLGGSGDENTCDIQVLQNGNIAIFGSTTSNDILITSSSYQTNYGGGFDGYLAILSPDGSQVLYSTYLGGSGQDEIQYLTEDNQGRLWICGISTSELPLIGGGYNDPGSWQFIACFDPELNNLIHYHLVGAGEGATNMYWPSAFMVDDCNRIYLTGDGGSQTVSNVNTTPDALYSEGSFYTAVYGADMSELIYGSYLGGNHRHGPDNQYNRKGIICQSVCSNINTPVYPQANAYSDTQVATWEGSTWIIDMDSPATVSAFDYEPLGSTCIPYPVHFTNWSDSASYQWNFGDGNGWMPDQGVDVWHTFTESGTYYVQLIATNTQSCNYADTTGWWIVTPIGQSPMQLSVESSTGNLCELPITATLQYTGNGADSFEWHDSEGNVLGTDSILEINISNMNGVQIILYGIESSCNYADSIITTIVPSPSPDATFIANDSLLVAQEEGSYQWYFNGNAIEGANDPGYLAAESGNYSLSVTNEFGCTSFSEMQFIEVMVEELSEEMISVYPNPTVETITISSGSTFARSLLIRDSKGRLVKEITGINMQSVVVDCHGFASGTYYVSFIDRNGEISTIEFFKK
jgi:PKD repeat protein